MVFWTIIKLKGQEPCEPELTVTPEASKNREATDQSYNRRALVVRWAQGTSILACQQISLELVTRGHGPLGTLLAPPPVCGLEESFPHGLADCYLRPSLGGPLPASAPCPPCRGASSVVPSAASPSAASPSAASPSGSHSPQPPLRAATSAATASAVVVAATAIDARLVEVTARCHVGHGG